MASLEEIDQVVDECLPALQAEDPSRTRDMVRNWVIKFIKLAPHVEDVRRKVKIQKGEEINFILE